MFLPLQLTDITFSDAVLIAITGFTIVIVVLMALALFVKLLSAIIKAFSGKKAPAAAVSAPATVSAPVTQPAVQPAVSAAPSVPSGYVALDGISAQDAAVVMAITSSKTGIPLERLSFRSINREPVKLINISDRDAAAVMAVTSAKTGIPLDRLYFKSIKLMEE